MQFIIAAVKKKQSKIMQLTEDEVLRYVRNRMLEEVLEESGGCFRKFMK